jgi:multidrug transporter EmrE-like cation transporter
MDNIKRTEMKKKHTLKKTNYLKPIIIVISCTLFTSLGQILFKYSSKNLTDIASIVTSMPLIFGLIAYALGSVLLIIALKYGDLSIVYPFIALSFIWVTLASIYLFQEHVNSLNWLGIASILLGVSFIGFGSKK